MNSKEEDIAKILRDNIYFAGQLGDYVIHGAIEKIIQYFEPAATDDWKAKLAEAFHQRSFDDFDTAEKSIALWMAENLKIK